MELSPGFLNLQKKPNNTNNSIILSRKRIKENL